MGLVLAAVLFLVYLLSGWAVFKVLTIICLILWLIAAVVDSLLDL